MKTKLFVFFISFLFFSCAAGPKSINFNKLPSKTFTLNTVIYATDLEEFNHDIPLVFAALPVHDTVRAVEKEYGITINKAILETESITIKSLDTPPPCHYVEYQTDDAQQLSFFYRKSRQEAGLEVNIILQVFKDKKVAASDSVLFFIPGWSPY